MRVNESTRVNLFGLGLIFLLAASSSCSTCPDAKIAEEIFNRTEEVFGRLGCSHDYDLSIVAPNDNRVFVARRTRNICEVKIAVEVRNGAVVVNGQIATEEQKELFDAIVRNNKCVTSVQNNVTFILSKQDLEMQKTITERLRSIIPDQYFEIYVKQGVVEIMGSVPNSKLPDVMKVIDDAKPKAVNKERLNVTGK
jgi:hypothetical protein